MSAGGRTDAEQPARSRWPWTGWVQRWLERREEAPAIDLVEHHSRDRLWRDQVMRNAPALFSASLFAFVVIKVLLIAQSNVSTGLALIARAGPLQVFAGTAVLGLPFLGTGLTNAAGILARTNRLNRLQRRRLWTYYGLGAFWLSWVLPWATTIFLIAFPAISLLLWRKERNEPATKDVPFAEFVQSSSPSDLKLREIRARIQALHEQDEALPPDVRKDPDRASRKEINEAVQEYNDRAAAIRAAQTPALDSLAISLLVATMFPLLQFALNDDAWLPAEDISTRNGGVFTGYVLSTADKWTTILGDDPRLIITLPEGDVVGRRVCAVTYAYNGRRTLWQLGGERGPDYDSCVSSEKEKKKRAPKPTPTVSTTSPTGLTSGPTTTSPPRLVLPTGLSRPSLTVAATTRP